MNPILQRASMLMGQSRYEEAEKELRRALAVAPEDPGVMRFLALCLSQRKKYDDACHFVDTAIGLAPDDPDNFFVRSIVLQERNRFEEAFEDIRRAIAIDPDDERFHGQLATIHLQKRQWREALDAAEAGLQIDPENDACTNIRSVALVNLGRRAEAAAGIDDALQRNPEDARTHANMGWTMLHQGKPHEAMSHFREALRLDPDAEWARIGIVEAMKARNFFYRWMLAYFLWCQKLAQKGQWALILGAWLAYQILRSVGANNPALAPWILPLLIGYIVFVASTWLAVPLFNLTLFTSKFGRLALSREEKITAVWVGIVFTCSLTLFVGYFVFDHLAFVLMGASCAMLVPCISCYYLCDEGWPRQANRAMLAGLVLLFAIASFLMIRSFGVPIQKVADLRDVAVYFAAACCIGGFASQIIVQVLVAANPRL